MPAQTRKPPAPRPAGRKKPASRRPRKPDTARTRRILYCVALVLLAAVLIEVVLIQADDVRRLARQKVPDWVDVQILDESAGGRRTEKLEEFNDVAIHYVANPGSTAQQNHDFFNQPQTQVSAHFVVGLEGEVIQCLPLEEKSSATNERNRDTISIEVCHPGPDGQFTPASYDALVKLTAWLCDHGGIGRDHVIRHYDVTGKLCPLYYVEHPEAWEQFLLDVKNQ